MIEIYSLNELSGSGQTSASGETDLKTNTEVIVYINYQKGDEASLDVSFEVFEQNCNDWFPLQVDTGFNMQNYSLSFQVTGKYRIVIPVASSEEKIKVNAVLNGSAANPGTATIWVVPNHYRN